MPVRKIKKNYRNVTGISSASKAVGQAQFESTLERDFLRLLEFSPEVKRFEVQPLTIHWRDNSHSWRSYTPDVLVTFTEATSRPPWLCEVKYRSDLRKNWPELHPKFIQAIRDAKHQGWRFRLISEVEIRGHDLDAAKFLLPFRRLSIPPERKSRLLSLVDSLGESTPQGILQTISPDLQVQAEWLPALWQLVANFDIGMDFETPITMTSKLWSQP